MSEMRESPSASVRVTRLSRPPEMPGLWSRVCTRFQAKRKRSSKIVGLVPARNEAARIGFCLRALAQYTDAIVFLDDFSTDDTLDVVKSLAEECGVEEILFKDRWSRDESGDRNALLLAGRRIGGTHFVVIDADEVFTANSMENDFLRRRILALKPREQLSLHWIQLWRSIEKYRTGDSLWAERYKRCIFCDDGIALYKPKFIHCSRIPNMKRHPIEMRDDAVGLLHFQFVNWDHLVLKQKWYRWLERVHNPSKPVEVINAKYARSLDETNLELTPVPEKWLSGYKDFDASGFDVPDECRIKQMKEWREQYGESFFEGLDD